jgi:hypothetical protein
LFNDRNIISDSGAARIAEALESNTCCNTLLLQKNKIGDVGAAKIAQLLELNSTLTTVDLRYNPIGMAGLKLLAHALDKNEQMVSFAISFTRVRAVPKPGSRVPSAKLLQNVEYMKCRDMIASALERNKRTIKKAKAAEEAAANEIREAVSQVRANDPSTLELDLHSKNLGDKGIFTLQKCSKVPFETTSTVRRG